MGVQLVPIRDDPLESLLDLEWVAAGREPGPVRHPEDVGVDGDGRLTEGDVEDDIGGLAADPGSSSSAARSSGTLPPCSATSFRDSAARLRALPR